jgi:UDP-N-acetylglucosamine 4,6-dehydratase
MFKNKSVLITGGSGSWGKELTTQLLERKPMKVIIFSRGELAQVEMQRKFNDDRIEYVIGDVRDADAVDRLFSRGVDYVFHLAALKHVPVCENQPQEAIKTNIDGTVNVINAAIKHKTRKVIDVSTDKAVSPTNLYGFTKAVGGKLTIQANNLTEDTDFVCIRGGNVLGSNGSVVPLFIDQILKSNKISLTDGCMTRYFLTLSEAISLLFQAVEVSVGGETYVMNMPSFRISDVAKALIDHYGNGDTTIEEIGIRPGEKLDEELVSQHEAVRSYIFNEDYYIILSDIDINRNYRYVETLNRVAFERFTSADNLKSVEYLKELLDKGGFLV